MNELFTKYIPSAILILLLLSFYYSFFILPNPRYAATITQINSDILSLNAIECTKNSTKECDIKDCAGTKTCRNGKWSTCLVKTICKPDLKYPCIENSCAVGYKICNECGTGYSECTIPSQINNSARAIQNQTG